MSQVAESPIPLAQKADTVILRARGVRKTFRMGDSTVEVLKSVDLSLKPGEFVAIEGRSGSGKSTLLHILAGLDAPDAGAVELDGVDIAPLAIAADQGRRRMGMALASLARLLLIWLNRSDRKLARIRNTQFGFVFQFYHLLPELTVLENVLLAQMIENSWLSFNAKKAQLRERATALLNELGLGHRLKHRPNQLSGGERQRVAIGRALMNSPRILFADEPTGNLDAETGKQIMGVLEKLHRENGQTIVMVTHDRSLAHQADRVLILKDGKLEKPPG
jgi:lipoprotein-releasing system ATP-binding protein